MITFLRHYKLQQPFDNWKNMTISDYQKLTEGSANPHISHDVDDYLSANYQLKDFSKYELIFVSDFKRTLETAQAIKSKFRLKLNIESNSLFNEIPSQILNPPTESEFQSMKDRNIQQISKRRIYNKGQKILRLVLIDQLLKNSKYENILIISHSYLIGLLNYYYNTINRNIDIYEENKDNSYEIGGYIKGFSIED